MKRTRQILALILALAVTALLAACGSQPQTSTPPANSASSQSSSTSAPAAGGPETVKIGFIYPLSGGTAESGSMSLHGAELAVKNINEAGGIKSLGGAKLELVTFDATSDPAQTKSVAERALADEDIVACVGAGTSTLTLPMLPAFEKAQVPLVTFANAADLTNQGYQYIFSITNRGTQIGENQGLFIGYLNDELNYNIKTVAILWENSANGISAAEGNRKTAESLGLEVVFDESYPSGLTDATAIVTAMKNSNADAVIPFTYMTEAKLIYQTMRDLDYYPLIVGNSNWPSFYEALGDATNGIVAAGNWNHRNKIVMDNPEYQAIVDQFKEEYGYFMTEQSGPSYETIRVIAAGLEACGSTDSAALRDAISGLKMDTMLLSGTLEFNEAGENIHGVPTVTQWQYGEPVTVFPVEYAGGEYMPASAFDKK